MKKDGIEVKLDEISSDIKEMKVHIEELRQDYFGRKATNKLVHAGVVLIAMLSGFVSNLLFRLY